MLKTYLTLILAISFFISFGQKPKEIPLDKPSEGKSMVYFIRSGGGSLINFRVYDYDQPIGKLKSGKYIKYETEPGEHVFWASSENKDFLKANLDPNKIYVVNIIGQMGLAFARVEIKGLNPEEFRDKKLLYLVMSKHNEADNDKLDSDIEEMNWEIEQALEKFKKRDNNGHMSIGVLEPHHDFENANKPIKKK